MPVRPIALSLLASVALVAGLTACTSTPPDEPLDPNTITDVDVCAVTSGDQSDAVTVAGDLGTEPTVTFDTGLATTVTQRTIAIEGPGEEVPAGGTATVAYVLYDATTGERVDGYGYGDDESVAFTADVTTVLAGIAKSIGCTTVGSRVVTVVAPDDAFGDDGYTDLGIAGGDTLIFVMDIEALIPTRADGVDQPVVDGLPTVVLDDDGAPTITLPATDAPTELQLAVLKLGSGDVVAADSSVIVQYTGVLWSTGEVFEQSWASSGPVSLVVDEVPAGLAAALTGQPVGSQVLVVVPPALGHGEATADSTNELAGETLVFVVDILAIS